MKDIAVLIPAYKPSEALITLLHDLIQSGFEQIVVVNDGSGDDYDSIFKQAAAIPQVIVLSHSVNQGKGQALKTGFKYIYHHHPEWKGVITADADGQHQPNDILRIAKQMYRIEHHGLESENKGYMVLGIRDFSQKHVPWKSRFGNVITRNVFYYFTGEVLTDTQTGLRGFPRHVLPWLLGITGARYDYEMNMLALAKQNGMTIYQVPIQTIYVKGNPTSHFNPIKDSYYVYKIFFKFGASGLASYGIDIGLFWLLCQILKGDFPHLFIIMATIIARACSSLFNYWVNRHMVFGQGASLSIFKYYALAVTVMLVSAGAVQGLYALLGTGEVYLKVLVDIILFLASFLSQKYWVFRKRA